MAAIFALALAAAVYPQLLAVVVVILTRPRPRPMLWICYLAGFCVSVAASAAILIVFRSRGTIAGTSSTRLGPSAYLILGALALGVAVVVATPHGRELLGRELPFLRRRAGSRSNRSRSSRSERALREGSAAIVAVVGGVLGVPGPFDLVALGRLARGDYGVLEIIFAIIAFSLIKFLLIEAPLICYAIAPERTSAVVTRFAGWTEAYKLQIVAGVVGLVGLFLIGRGIAGLGG